jgi:hypothetical protein
VWWHPEELARKKSKAQDWLYELRRECGGILKKYSGESQKPKTGYKKWRRGCGGNFKEYPGKSRKPKTGYTSHDYLFKTLP